MRAIAGCAALVPVILTIASSLTSRPGDGGLTPSPPFLSTVVLMATAVAIAVFGSHKIHELHERALEGRRIGQYRLGEILGFGGMGAVYMAEHVLLRRTCAIKLIRPERAGDPKTFKHAIRRA